jgi:hypothetical protein
MTHNASNPFLEVCTNKACDNAIDRVSVNTEYGYNSNHHSQSSEDEPLLFHPNVARQNLADLDLDQANNSIKSTLLQKSKTIQPNLQHFPELLTGHRIVLFLAISIIGCLVIGLFNCLNSIHNNTIVYGTIGTYIFLIYYLINILWYTIFTIIHIFILSTQLFYSINRMNYIECIVLNYRQINYNYVIKILFVSAIIVILFLDINNTITSIPLYYNIIMIEVVLSILLYLCINKIINNYDFIKNMNINNYIPIYTDPIYTDPIYTDPIYTDPIYTARPRLYPYNTEQIYSV